LFTREESGRLELRRFRTHRKDNRVNAHKNARLTIAGRKLLIERIAVMGLTAAAEAAGVSLRTARKWLRRFELGR
jgi:hypothetical protein